MKRKYSKAFSPPAPTLPVRISTSRGMDFAELEGKLDSGADLCALPVDTIEALDLPPLRAVRAAGFAGTLQEAIVYRLRDRTCGQASRPGRATSHSAQPRYHRPQCAHPLRRQARRPREHAQHCRAHTKDPPIAPDSVSHSGSDHARHRESIRSSDPRTRRSEPCWPLHALAT